MDSLIIIGITVLILIFKLGFKPAADKSDKTTEEAQPDFKTLFKTLFDLPDREGAEIVTDEPVPPAPPAIQRTKPKPQPRPKQIAVRTPKAVNATAERVIRTSSDPKAKVVTAAVASTGLHDSTTSDIHDIAEQFDLRRAVIYSEILKPKFDE